MLMIPLYKKIALLALILTLIVLFLALDLRRYVTFEQMQVTREALERVHASHRVSTTASFLALYLFLSALALPGPLVLSLIAGAVFGVFLGATYTSIAATGGASLTFLAARYLFRNLLRKKLGARLERVNAELEKDGLMHLLFLRLVPVFPFTMINLAAAVTSMRLRTFFLGTLVGSFPINLILANAGAGMATITGAKDVFTLRVIGSLSLLGLLALAPVIAGWMRGSTGANVVRIDEPEKRGTRHER